MKVVPFHQKRGYFLQKTRYFRQNNAYEGLDISSQKHLSEVRTLDLRPPDPPPPVRTMSEVLEVFFIASLMFFSFVLKGESLPKLKLNMF